MWGYGQWTESSNAVSRRWSATDAVVEPLRVDYGAVACALTVCWSSQVAHVLVRIRATLPWRYTHDSQLHSTFAESSGGLGLAAGTAKAGSRHKFASGCS